MKQASTQSSVVLARKAKGGRGDQGTARVGCRFLEWSGGTLERGGRDGVRLWRITPTSIRLGDPRAEIGESHVWASSSGTRVDQVSKGVRGTREASEESFDVVGAWSLQRTDCGTGRAGENGRVGGRPPANLMISMRGGDAMAAYEELDAVFRNGTRVRAALEYTWYAGPRIKIRSPEAWHWHWHTWMKERVRAPT